MFEYMTTYFAIEYFLEPRGDHIYEKPEPIDPDPMSLLENERYNNLLNQWGREGWELVNVQPLLRGCFHYQDHRGAGGYGYGYSLTAGYYFFFKRQK